MRLGGGRRIGNSVLQQARDRAPTRATRGRPHTAQRTDHRHLQPHQLCRRCAAGPGVPSNGTIAAPVGDVGCVRRAGARNRRSQAGFHQGQARRRGCVDVARRSCTRLAEGEAVGIFPEGRLTRDPMMWPERAKTGAVRLALRTGAPIVPVAMVGAHRVISRHRVVPNAGLQPGAPTEGRHPGRRTHRRSRV